MFSVVVHDKGSDPALPIQIPTPNTQTDSGNTDASSAKKKPIAHSMNLARSPHRPRLQQQTVADTASSEPTKNQ